MVRIEIGEAGLAVPFSLFSRCVSAYEGSAAIHLSKAEHWRPEEHFMERDVRDLLNLYNPNDPLDHAWTIPSPWYFDPDIHELEQQGVFAKNWQVVGRAEQVREKGNFFTADLAGEPIVVARGEDGQLRAFNNVCRHHAAAVVTEAEGCAKQFRCPYHGWTYGNDGVLKGMVEFEGVRSEERRVGKGVGGGGGSCGWRESERPSS